MTRYDEVADWLERLAEGKEQNAQGETGAMFAATEANALRDAALMLREHPEAVTASEGTEGTESPREG